MAGELVLYDEMCHAIDAAYEVDEVKAIRDKAVAMEHYFRVAKNPEPERRACEIRLRAERKSGELLRAAEKAKGAAGNQYTGKVDRSTDVTGPKTLADRGITKQQSSDWQKLAGVPEEQFEAALAGATKPSTTGILAAAEDYGIRAQAGAAELRPMDRLALRLWGVLRDFERDGLLEREPGEILDEMTDGMRADVLRLIPLVLEWLEQLDDESRPERPQAA